jgi:diguanylate cyclase (GGDEF)-like protein
MTAACRHPASANNGRYHERNASARHVAAENRVGRESNNDIHPQRSWERGGRLRARLIIIFAVLLCTAASAATQHGPRWYALEEVLFRHYGSDDGRPLGEIVAMAQDARGLAWLVSSRGLVRWDGRDARRLASGLEDVDRDLRTLEAAPDGALWLGTGRGLVRFDPETRSFERIDLGAAHAVLDLVFTEAAAWLATERGVLRLDAETGAIRHWLESLQARVFDVLIGPDGSIWAATESGLYRKTPAEVEFTRVALGDTVPPETRIASLLRTVDERVWVGTARRGAFTVGPDGAVAPVGIPGLSGEWIYAMLEVEPGVVWLGTFGGGIVEVRPAEGLTRRIRHNRLVPRSLAHDEVWMLARDRRGRVWVGTGAGVSVHRPGSDAVRTIVGDKGESGALRGRRVEAIVANGDGTLWLGYRRGGIDRIDPVRGRLESILADPERPASALPDGAVETLALLDDGTLLAGSNWGIYHHRNGNLTRLDVAGGPGAAYVAGLAPTGNGFWAGGTAGLWRFDASESGWRARAVEADLTDERVSVLELDRRGRLIVGTWNGLNWLSAEGDPIARIPRRSAESPFANGFVSAVAESETGEVWIGTAGGGLYLAGSDADGARRSVDRGDGLPSDTINALEFDRRGRLWVATTGGLAVVMPATGAVHVVDTGRGDLLAPYARASAATREGELLFGGSDGLSVVHPERWAPAPVSLPLAVVDVTVGDAPGAPVEAGSSADSPVVVPAESNLLSFEFTVLDYGAERPWRYRYRLEGFDPDWRHTDQARPAAAYTGLPPGRYRFEVQSGDRQGGWADNSASMFVRVEPHWHETLPARLAFVIAGLLLIGALVRWRTRWLRQRRDELEAQVRERTAELIESTEALQRKSRELQEASTTDSLTGLRNRRFLEDNMRRDVADVIRRYRDAGEDRRPARGLLIFMIDLDFFKRVNDRYGHAAGDEVLIQMRRRLETMFRETDYLVRWGGEEFMAVTRHAQLDDAEVIAERLRQKIRMRPFETPEGRQLELTASIGVVPFPFDAEHPDRMTWLEAAEIADRCLYVAKRSGRDCWVCARKGGATWVRMSAEQVTREFRALVRDGAIRLTSNRPTAELTTR